MDLKRFTDKARQALDDRDGPGRLEPETERPKTTAGGPDAPIEKARAAGEAIKQAARTPGPDRTPPSRP